MIPRFSSGSAPAPAGDRVRTAIAATGNRLFVSAVTAFEFCDLNTRGRFGADLPFADIVGQIGAMFIDLPAEIWRIVEACRRTTEIRWTGC